MDIVPFRPALAPAFASLNRAWIERLFALEPADANVLDDPESSIIAAGGQVFFAVEAATAVGTAAVLRLAPTHFELAKMAVAPSHQGRGIGEQLGRAAVAWARAQGATCVSLLTNSSLDGAIRLYHRLGFVRRPLPEHTGYARADVYMELDFPEPGPARDRNAPRGNRPVRG